MISLPVFAFIMFLVTAFGLGYGIANQLAYRRLTKKLSSCRTCGQPFGNCWHTLGKV